jgi:GAF domain-containing protein
MQCIVEISTAKSRRPAVVRAAWPDSIRIQYPPGEEHLRPGDIVEVRAHEAPLGPLQVRAQVASIDAAVDPRGRPVHGAMLNFVDSSDVERRALASRLDAQPSLVLTIGVGAELQLELQSDPRLRVVAASTSDEALRTLGQDDVAVLVLGPERPPSDGHALLSRAAAELPGGTTVNIVVGTGPRPELFQNFVDEDRVFYLSCRALAPAPLRAIVRAAAARSQRAFESDVSTPASVLEACVQICRATDLAGAARELAEALKTLLDAESAQCLKYDAQREMLLSIDPIAPESRTESAAAGLVGFVARTGEAVLVERVDADPRYDAEADNPAGTGDARFAAVPIVGTGGSIVGVLSVVRRAEKGHFAIDDRRALELLAECVAAPLSAVLVQARMRARLERRQPVRGSADIFRQEALDHHAGHWTQAGDLLRSSPPWLKRSPWLLAGLLAVGLAFMSVARLHEYASGPAVVRAVHKLTVNAPSAGFVRSIAVSPGDRLRAGDVVIQFDDPMQASTAGVSDASLRTPIDAVVGEIRVRVGQHVVAGEPLIGLVDEKSGHEVVALLPAPYAARLKAGMPIVLRLHGYVESREPLSITHVGEAIVGPHDAARYIGKEGPEGLAISGPVVIVRAQIGRPTFAAGAHEAHYQDGMTGEAQVVTNSEPMIAVLVPGLKEFLKTRG